MTTPSTTTATPETNCPECHYRSSLMPRHMPNCSLIDLESAKACLASAQKWQDHYSSRVRAFLQQSQRWEGKFRIVCHENNFLRKAHDKARDLERRLTAALAELERLRSELDASKLREGVLRDRLKTIYDATEGYADGAPDANAHDKLCNEISALAHP